MDVPTEDPAVTTELPPTAHPDVAAEDQAVTTELPPAPHPDATLCDSLASIFSGAFQIEMSTATAPFQDVVSGQTIYGCLSTLSVPFENIASLGDAISLSDAIMKTNGWEEDIRYGAGGPGAIMNGYRQTDSICMVTTEFGPIDDTLCSSDEPFAVCMDRLAADQKIYKVALNCAVVPGSSTSTGWLPPASAPAVLPPAFDSELVQSLVLTEIPPMLPTTFMIADEMALYPYVLTMETGLYEISLDFGEDCKGATACHFGVLAGSLTSGNELYSTPNIFVDVDRAVPVTLANGIQGYYIEGLCGASCSNSLIVWVQDFYQYIIGSKGASQAFLLDIVNSAITNQTP
jgi:hypothetical protein